MFESQTEQRICFLICVGSAVLGTIFASCAGANMSPGSAIAGVIWYSFAWGAYSIARSNKK